MIYRFLFFFLLFYSNFIFSQERIFVFKDEFVKEEDAFTMFGDSRTHFIFKMSGGSDWEDEEFLGRFKTICSANKLSIQNAGFGGSTTSDWLRFLKQEDTKKENYHKRIVLMIGGNDVLRVAKNWTGIFSESKSREITLDEIHARVVEIVSILTSWDKEVIIQTHFYANPNVKTKYYSVVNEALNGLNQRLISTYGEEKDKNISLVILPASFPSILFIDKIHLNQFGYIYHANFLHKELSRRCWW